MRVSWVKSRANAVKLKLGEKVMFALTVLVVIAAIGKGIMQARAPSSAQARDYYEWTEAGLKGQALYGKFGCNNCHRAMGVGEVGLAPVLDGEGTRRTRDWLQRYFENPLSVVPGSAHDGSLGPDFRALSEQDRQLLAEFLFGLKAGPASPNYPTPPSDAPEKRS
jgi:cbb3-type cytochrome oxidase cytochrome c subunit